MSAGPAHAQGTAAGARTAAAARVTGTLGVMTVTVMEAHPAAVVTEAAATVVADMEVAGATAAAVSAFQCYWTQREALESVTCYC